MGHYVFALSVRPSMGVNIFFCLKNTFYGGFEKVWGVFDVFIFCPCVRACVTLYVLSFVGWTCPGVLVRSTWNLFRSTIYELKLCTSYFWSTSVRPFVRQNGRNIASFRPSKKSGLWHSLPYIYIHTKKLEFCLKSDIFQFCWKKTTFDNARKLSIHWRKMFSHYCFSLLLHPVPMDVGWRAIRAPTDTFLVLEMINYLYVV